MQTSGLTTSALAQTYLPASTSTAQKLEASLNSFQSQLSALTSELQKSTSSTATTTNVSTDSLLTVLTGFSSYLNELKSAIGAGATSSESSTAASAGATTAISTSSASSQVANSTSTVSSALTTAYKDLANAPDNASYYVLPIEYGGVQSSVRLDNYSYQQWLTRVSEGQDPNMAAIALSGDGIGTGPSRSDPGFSPLGYALGKGSVWDDPSLSTLAASGASSTATVYGIASAQTKQAALKALVG